MSNEDQKPLLLGGGNKNGNGGSGEDVEKDDEGYFYGSTTTAEDNTHTEPTIITNKFKPLRPETKTWSFHEGPRLVGTGVGVGGVGRASSTTTTTGGAGGVDPNSPALIFRSPSTTSQQQQQQTTANKKSNKGLDFYLYCVIYAIVNVIISAPGLYGYAAVIFNNPIYNDHMNALSKLVIFSSLIHQLGFFLFSTLDFAIGTVQDAGLIFLSSMANKIAYRMLDDGHTEHEILSTTLVLLSLGTAVLGLVLIVMGKFRLADAVSYLPMPVVGGYLAFIGYFCCQAGVALCISQPLMNPKDWLIVFQPENLILAIPGLVTGLLLTLTSRLATNSGALPLVMVSIPAIFYFVLWVTDTTLDDVREDGWVGPVAPSVPVSDLFSLVDFKEVRWDLISDIMPTWIGMVFVVSFASCLDVAAISIDMGEPLDTNKELATVGISNLMSGITFGFTGSYIFSQTIFTYRTGVHSRLIGVLIMCVFMYIVISPVNVLQISPLFFLGSTLIFIGYDLMYEWLWEVRHQVFLSEYGIVWLTFLAIQIAGIDAGIIIGVLIAIVEQIVMTAQTTTVSKVEKRSRAVWSPSDSKLLHTYCYNSASHSPKIVTLEIFGTVFFGSALSLLNNILDETGLSSEESQSSDSAAGAAAVLGSPRTPHTSSTILTSERRTSAGGPRNKAAIAAEAERALQQQQRRRRPPQFLVLDLRGVTNLDASATRGCFLQLVKMCAKHKILVCASGVSPRMEWMFRSHGVSFSDPHDGETFKGQLLNATAPADKKMKLDDDPDLQSSWEKILLFITAQEALEFCETAFLQRVTKNNPHQQRSKSLSSGGLAGMDEEQSLPYILKQFLESSDDENELLERLESERYHSVVEVKAGQHIFHKGTYPDAFYIVLNGCVANSTSSTHVVERQKQSVLSGAGFVKPKRVGSISNLFDPAFLQAEGGTADKKVGALWRIGGIVGYHDYLMERPRVFQAMATQDGTKVAKFTHSNMNLLQSEDPPLYAVMQKVLLKASILDLANCTCYDV